MAAHSAMRIDLHVHSAVSACSVLSVRDILDRAKSLGLDGVCITDHDSTDVLSQIKEGFQPDGLLVLVGMEYTTPQGHFVVHGPVEALAPGMDLATLVDAVNLSGGAVVAAHPYRGWLASDPSVFSCSGLAAIEVVNGRNTEEENRRAEISALKAGFNRVAGSDAHSIEELGRCPTDFSVPITSRDDLVRALKRGLCEPAPTMNLLSSMP